MAEELVLQDQEVAETTDSGVWKNILNIFFSPSETFRSISIRPTWILPFVLIVLASVIYEASLSGVRMEDLKTKIRASEEINAKEIERRVGNIDAQASGGLLSATRVFFGAGLISAFEFVKLLSISAVVWISLFLVGSLSEFKRVLSLCAFCTLVALPEALVKIPLILTKGTTHVYVSLAAFLPTSWQGSILFSVCEKLDFFVLWKIILIAVGLHLVFKMSRFTSYAIIGCLWALWILASITLGGFIQIT